MRNCSITAKQVLAESRIYPSCLVKQVFKKNPNTRMPTSHSDEDLSHATILSLLQYLLTSRPLVLEKHFVEHRPQLRPLFPLSANVGTQLGSCCIILEVNRRQHKLSGNNLHFQPTYPTEGKQTPLKVVCLCLTIQEWFQKRY